MGGHSSPSFLLCAAVWQILSPLWSKLRYQPAFPPKCRICCHKHRAVCAVICMNSLTSQASLLFISISLQWNSSSPGSCPGTSLSVGMELPRLLLVWLMPPWCSSVPGVLCQESCAHCPHVPTCCWAFSLALHTQSRDCNKLLCAQAFALSSVLPTEVSELKPLKTTSKWRKTKGLWGLRSTDMLGKGDCSF